MPRRGTIQYSDALLIEHLQVAAITAPSPMSAAGYMSHRIPGGPTQRTFIIRFGSWSEALDAAGLPTTGRPQRSDVVPLIACVAAVADYIAETGETSVQGYAIWSRHRPVPSQSIIRERCGSWNRAKEMASGL